MVPPGVGGDEVIVAGRRKKCKARPVVHQIHPQISQITQIEKERISNL
jgi:hypothetical protein